MIIYNFFSVKNHLEQSIFRNFFGARGSSPGPFLGVCPQNPVTACLLYSEHCKDRRRLALLGKPRKNLEFGRQKFRIWPPKIPIAS